MKHSLIIALISILAMAGRAQPPKSPRPWQFHSLGQWGLLEGQAGPSYQLQFINGLQHGPWFGGIGLGLDEYRNRSIPIFFDLRRSLGIKGHGLFIYAQAGLNYYWRSSQDQKQFPMNDRWKPGFYGEAGFGNRFRIGSRIQLFMSLGYSYKKLVEKGQNYEFNPGGFSGPNPTERIDYRLNRLSIKAGIEF